MTTGAIVCGRGTAEPAGYWNGDNHDGVPIFIVSRREAPAELATWPLHVIPVLLGQGRRLFDNLDPEQIELGRTRVVHGEGGVTHMHHRVGRG